MRWLLFNFKNEFLESRWQSHDFSMEKNFFIRSISILNIKNSFQKNSEFLREKWEQRCIGIIKILSLKSLSKNSKKLSRKKAILVQSTLTLSSMEMGSIRSNLPVGFDILRSLSSALESWMISDNFFMIWLLEKISP